MYVFIAEFSILFHWSIIISLFSYHTVLFMVTLQYILKSGSVMALALFFFLKTALDTWYLLWGSHVLEKITFSSVYPSDLDVPDTSRINMTQHLIKLYTPDTSEEKIGKPLSSLLLVGFNLL